MSPASPNREQILQQVQDLMARLFELDREAIVPEAHLIEDLDLDSIDAIDMLSELQTMGFLRIGEEEIQKIRTVADVVDLAERISAASRPEAPGE